jgi:tryptophan synthase alpha chain
VSISFTSKPGLVVYLTAGDPSIAATRSIAIAAIDAGAAVIELGIPFSDPLADGPVIQRAMDRAVHHGVTLADVLALAKEIRTDRPNAGIILFGYLNPIVRYGLTKFADAASAAGADGVLVTDLIVEEAADYIAEMRRVNLATVFLAAPTSPDARLKAIAENSRGFIYAISRTGITGTQTSLSNDAASLVARTRQWTRLPIAVGFGISKPEHVAEVTEFADAAVVGSAIVELIEHSSPEAAPDVVARFIEGLRSPTAAPAR